MRSELETLRFLFRNGKKIFTALNEEECEKKPAGLINEIKESIRMSKENPGMIMA